MALFDLNDKQFQELKTEIRSLTQAVNALSVNVGKWQGTQTTALQAGLAGLIGAITGADVAEIQERINAASNRLDTGTNQLKQSVDAATE